VSESWPQELERLAEGAVDALGVGKNFKVITTERIVEDAITLACEELKLVEHAILYPGDDADDIDLYGVISGIRKRLALASDSGATLAKLMAGAARPSAEAAE
jgi:hypothetical protein